MKLLLLFFLTTSFLECEPEPVEYPWHCEVIDEEWSAVEESLPMDNKTIFALDCQNNLWVGYYNNGLFIAFEEDNVLIHPGNITHWKYITPVE